MLQHLSQQRAKVILPLVSKAGGTPRQSPSILEGCLIGWQLCATFASHSLAWTHRASWPTILDVKPSMTWNAWNMRHRKMQKVTQEEVQVLGMKGDIWITQLRGHQGVIKSRMLLNTFCLVQPENVSCFTSWIFLDHLSFVFWVSPCSVRQTHNKSLMFIHLYKVFVSCDKLHSWMGDSNSSTPLHWGRRLGPDSPPGFHWEFQVRF